MKKLILFCLFALSLSQAVAQITFTAPVAYTTGVPTGAPSGQGSRLRIDLLTGWLYEWSPVASTWLKMGQGIDQTSGSVAPAYTPGIGQSWYAVNGANELYRYTGSGTSWDCLNCGGGGGAVASVNGLTGTVLLDLSLTGTTLSITGDASPVSFSGWDTNASNDFSGSWNDLTSVPAGFADGTDDGTTYTAGAGISINGSNVITNTGDTDASDDLTTASTAGGDLTGPFSNLQIATGVVGTAEIATNGVDAAEIAAGAVGPSELASTGVTPGSYTNANITVDDDGRVTAVANGSAAGDNLGNHTATQDLNMAGFNEKNVDTIYMEAGAHTGFITSDNNGLRIIDRQTATPAKKTILALSDGVSFTQDDGAGTMSFGGTTNSFGYSAFPAAGGNAGFTISSNDANFQRQDADGQGGMSVGNNAMSFSRSSVSPEYTDFLGTESNTANGLYLMAFRNIGGTKHTLRLNLFAEKFASLNYGIDPALETRVQVFPDSVVIGRKYDKDDAYNLYNQAVWYSGDSSQYLHYTGDRRSNIIQDRNALPDVKSVWLISGQAFSITADTDGSGYATISHSLTYTPQAVVATYQGDNPWFITITAKTSTDFTIKVWDNTGAPVTSSHVDFSYWIR